MPVGRGATPWATHAAEFQHPSAGAKRRDSPRAACSPSLGSRASAPTGRSFQERIGVDVIVPAPRARPEGRPFVSLLRIG